MDSVTVSISNRLLSLAAIGVTTFLAVQGRSREMVLSEQAGLLDLTHDTIFVRDMKDVITYWNRGAEELYGWKKAEAVGRISHQLMQTIFPTPLEGITAELLRTGRWEGELVHTNKDGTQAIVASRWSLQKDARGRPVAILETNNDISDRKRAEEALRQSENQWKAVFENNPTMYFMADAAGIILSVNAFGAEQLGYTADELVGSPVLNVFCEPDREDVQGHFARCFAQINRTMNWEARKVRKDGSVLWVRETARAVLLQNRPIILVACEDITERKRAEEALHKAQSELAHVTRVTTINALTSSIAHEVNQPLGAIVTNADVALRWLARQPPNLEEARETLEQIVKDGHRASEVIGRVRALLKKTATTRERVDLTELIQDTVALVHGEVLRHRILVRTELAPELPPVAGDRVQVQQVLLNLVMNGIEAMKEVTERPRELWIQSHTDESGAVRVAVQDAGVGLDPNSVDRLFETFYTTKPEGMGMGLAICRSIIEAHGGRLWASANKPRGAVFEFSLPPEKDETAPAANARPPVL